MKEEVKNALESALGLAIFQEIKLIQRLWRGSLARKLFRSMKVSRAVILKHLYSYFLRKKFRSLVTTFTSSIMRSVLCLQRAFKRRLRYARVLSVVNQRV